ncbi:MAG: D-glycero-D-manno-heptose 1,7-bisphosphate phosphatase [Sphingobacteriales bacterium]|jgi:D-glycero-D-manno-heptose 1,7-bisphosphate phosphatase
MKKIIFLDRDGVLNREIGNYVMSPEELEILPGRIDALKRLKAQGYCFVIVTNQGGIAKGLYSHEGLKQIHNKLEKHFANEGITFEAIYYSPHHQDFGASLDRKPGSLMVEKGLARFKAKAEDCYLIGDSPRDIEAAAAAGVKGIKITANEPLDEALSEILR